MEVIGILKLFIVVWGPVMAYSAYNFYRTSNGLKDFEFIKLKMAVDLYKDYKKQHISYELFVRDFIELNTYIATDRESLEIKNEKWKAFKNICRLLQEGRDIVEDFFEKDRFRYKKEYQELKKEWADFEEDVINGFPSINNLFLIKGEKRKRLLEKIRTYLKPGVIGKSVAVMIIAIEENGYWIISSHSHTKFFDAIRKKYRMEIGSNQSIEEYLKNREKIYDDELRPVINYFKID